jgi:hypothetical protein
MRLTAEHERILREIGHSGGTRLRLGAIADSRELAELEYGGYVWCDRAGATSGDRERRDAHHDFWYLTARGATTIAMDPERTYRCGSAPMATQFDVLESLITLAAARTATLAAALEGESGAEELVRVKAKLSEAQLLVQESREHSPAHS